MSAEKRPPGRPVGSTKDGAFRVTIHPRLTEQQAETFAAIGGSEWLRKALDRARGDGRTVNAAVDGSLNDRSSDRRN